jgi:GTPase SAR1 family protein
VRSVLPAVVRQHTPWKLLYVQQLHLSIPTDPLAERRARLLRLYHLQNGVAQYMSARIAVLGDRGVGKTSLIVAFAHDTFVDPTSTAATLYQSYLPPLQSSTRTYHTRINTFFSSLGGIPHAITLHFLEPPGALYVTSAPSSSTTTTTPSTSSPSSSSSSTLPSQNQPSSSSSSSSSTTTTTTTTQKTHSIIEVESESRWQLLCALKDVDIVLLTFNVADVESLHNLRRFYLPFVRAHCLDVPVLICGLQTDRRRLPHSAPVVSEREGRTTAHSLGAHSYLEFAVVDSREPDLLDIITRLLLSLYHDSQRSRCSLQ